MEEVIGSKMQLLTHGSSWKRRPLGVDDGPQLATDATVWRERPLPRLPWLGTARRSHSTFQMAILPSSRPAPLST